MHYARNIPEEKINIILIGATGVGKSALVNAVFGESIVQSGDGEPITQFIEKIEIPSKGLTLWDTKGIEAKDYQETIENLTLDIERRFRPLSPFNNGEEAPHVIWICIKESSKRIEQREHDLINIANEFGIPVIIVFTNTQDENGIEFFETAKEKIDEKYKSFIKDRYVRVNSVSYKFRGTTIPAFGLDELLHLTECCFEEGEDNVFEKLYNTKVPDEKLELGIIAVAKPKFWGLFS